MRNEASLRPILMSGLGVTFLAFLDTGMKVISTTYPLMQAITMRYGAGAVIALAIYLLFAKGWPSPAAFRRNGLRAVVVLATAACFFTAISRLPLVEAITLTFLAPLLMALLGRIILKEPIAVRALVAILVGFAGVLVIARGQEASQAHAFDVIGLLAALGCAFFYALSMVLMRQQSSQDSTLTIVMLSNCFAFLFVLPAGLWQWQPVTLEHWAITATVGLFGTFGHLCLAWAYARGHAARLGIMEYTAFVWAMIFGYYLFAEVPTNWTLAGATLIMAACLFATFSAPRARPA
ncbi:DMT family transporter [Labrys sp. (in: a-proteobacteria)]|uniref:DMT family transporter n=1 Tax=Labrys sp. (in: a-proteobacteria) TaxID=1917972 RepID=UPI0039E2CDA4